MKDGQTNRLTNGRTDKELRSTHSTRVKKNERVEERQRQTERQTERETEKKRD